MTVPDPPDSELAVRLIRAGMRETPAPGTLQRTLAGVGLGAGALGTAASSGALAATKAATSITAVALTKWAGVGATAGILLAASAHGVYRATHPAPHSAVTPAPAPARKDPGTAKPVTNEKSPPTHVEPETSPVIAAAPARPSPSAPPNADTEAPLAAELAFVDRGREAFQRGDLAAALARLDGYERAFPEQRLLPEVLYLRMQALRKRGDTSGAAGLAGRLVRDFPNNPHVSSARAVLRGESGR